MRTSLTPSDTHIENAIALQQWQFRLNTSVRLRGSECPPVGPIACPAMNSRGPAIAPSSTACFNPQSAPPVSRTVVNPRASMSRMLAAARAVPSVNGTASRFRVLTAVSMTCTWLSISPGITTRPPQSTTSASPAETPSPTSTTVSPSTRISTLA